MFRYRGQKRSFLQNHFTGMFTNLGIDLSLALLQIQFIYSNWSN